VLTLKKLLSSSQNESIMRIARPILVTVVFLVSLSVSAQSQKPTARLNHTAIYVMDIKVTKAFYDNIIGLDTIPEPFHDGKHVWYRIGPGSSLHVIQGATEKKTYYKNQHTCFSVGSVEKFIEVLKKNNIQYEDVSGKVNSVTTRIDGVRQIWLQDPDGYWLEINDAKE
jgi:lactoylglutathione lyase